MAKLRPELQGYADDGLKLCRAGDWNKGLSVLAAVLDQRNAQDDVPGVVYSFLGYGVARFQGKLREGIKLCEHALKLQFYDADNHWNLARIQALAGERLNAHATIEKGLKLDSHHEGLLALQKDLGVRRRPVLGFLDRNNPINVFLGRMRHNMRKQPEPESSKPPLPRERPSRQPGAAAPGSTPAPRNRPAAGAVAGSSAASKPSAPPR